MQSALAIAALELWTRGGGLLLALAQGGALVLGHTSLVSHEAVGLPVAGPGPLDAEIVGALVLVRGAEDGGGCGAVLLVTVLLVHAVIVAIAVPGQVNAVAIGALELVRVAPEPNKYDATIFLTPHLLFVTLKLVRVVIAVKDSVTFRGQGNALLILHTLKSCAVVRTAAI